MKSRTEENEPKLEGLKPEVRVDAPKAKMRREIARQNAETALSLSLFEAGSDDSQAALTSNTGTAAGREEGVIARTLWEGETWLDGTTAQLISQLSGLRWPRRWSDIRRFDVLSKTEIERLQRESQGGESPFLTRKIRKGVEVWELSARGEEDLVAREGERGFRRVIGAENGLSREFFVKRLTTSDGYVEMRLSWFGVAWPLFEEASTKIERTFQTFLAQKNGPQRTLFEELDEQERERADSQLRLMESVRHGRLVLDYLVRTFGRDGKNPVSVAAWDLRSLLGCEKDPHGMRRVRGCLEALSEIRFEMHLKGAGQKGRTFGALLSEVQYVGGGKGDHGDGMFHIHLAPSAFGCLAVFGVEKAGAEFPPPRTIAPAALQAQSEFNWKKTLSPAERERLQTGYTRSQMSLAPHYDRAHDLSGAQAGLLRWIEKQLTHERDASRFKKTVVTPGDRTPRLYSQVFCPALPSGRTFYGALGHFRDRPERGRKLATIAKEIGLVWPSPRAKVAYNAAVESLLQDLRLIVEDVLEGVLVLCLPLPTHALPPQGEKTKTRRVAEAWKWEIIGQNPHQLDFLAAHATVFPFISPEYMTTLITKLGAYYKKRFESGESPYLVEVRHVSDRGLFAETDTAGVTSSETLSHRLYAARRAKGLTQAQIAPLFGVSRVMIAKWERGAKIPTDTPPTPISPGSAAKIEAWLLEVEPKASP